jgi:hypothetical protein
MVKGYGVLYSTVRYSRFRELAWIFLRGLQLPTRSIFSAGYSIKAGFITTCYVDDICALITEKEGEDEL